MIPNNLFPNLARGLAPLSAGTFVSYICVVCQLPDGSWEAVQAQDTPHPVYTNGLGKDIVQTQMVTIGGIDGLNN
jgi:hypothetical protein